MPWPAADLSSAHRPLSKALCLYRSLKAPGRAGQQNQVGQLYSFQ